ncbi:hypothetical protein SNEBB_007777 [Seison nebaliae]|nr:hypothetical protein SNEBB_007777 [Seison nebaliae]
MKPTKASTILLVIDRSILQTHHKHYESLNRLVVNENIDDKYCDYQLLFMQRNTKAEFMPNIYVWPGGKIDLSTDSNKSFRKICKYDDYMSRVGVLRELFEESGTLLCENLLTEDKLIKLYSDMMSEKKKFLEICEEASIRLKLNNLFLWNKWTTPKTNKDIGYIPTRRFDTNFYLLPIRRSKELLAIFPFESELVKKLTNEEAIDFQTFSPFEALELFKNKKINLAPPQFYECSRLLKYTPTMKILLEVLNRLGNYRERKSWLPHMEWRSIENENGRKEKIRISQFPKNSKNHSEDHCLYIRDKWNFELKGVQSIIDDVP